MPYDWRRVAGTNDVDSNLERTLDYIVDLTGKPAVIVTHSFGGLNTLAVLNKMNAETK